MSATVAEIGEWALIERIRSILATRFSERAGGDTAEPGVVEGVGDDAAVVRPRAGFDLVLETDDAVEGVHFRFDWLEPEQIGRRLAVQGLSDIAAMGAWPRWLLLNLALADTTPLERVEGLVAGFAGYAASFGAPVVGGNVAACARGVHASVTVVGELERGRHVTRRGGRPGDLLYVTGFPGRARAGWRCLERQVTGQAFPGVAEALAAFREPDARLREAEWLCEHAAMHAMIDLSDGLSGDAQHVAEASGVALVIEAPALIKDRVLVNAAQALEESALELALRGGDDFELLFACAPRLEKQAPAFERRFRIPLRRIGRVERGEGVWLERADGSRTRLEVGSFEHFTSVSGKRAPKPARGVERFPEGERPTK